MMLRTGKSKFKKVAFEAVHAAAQLASRLAADICNRISEKVWKKSHPNLGGYGIKKVYVADDDRLTSLFDNRLCENFADAAESLSADVILFPASAMGKDLGARVAAKLKAGLATDCVAIKVDNGSIIATRPVYAGKALVDVKINSPKKVFTFRPNVFNPGATDGIRRQRLEKISSDSSGFRLCLKSYRSFNRQSRDAPILLKQK